MTVLPDGVAASMGSSCPCMWAVSKGPGQTIAPVQSAGLAEQPFSTALCCTPRNPQHGWRQEVAGG